MGDYKTKIHHLEQLSTRFVTASYVQPKFIPAKDSLKKEIVLVVIARRAVRNIFVMKIYLYSDVSWRVL